MTRPQPIPTAEVMARLGCGRNTLWQRARYRVIRPVGYDKFTGEAQWHPDDVERLRARPYGKRVKSPTP